MVREWERFDLSEGSEGERGRRGGKIGLVREARESDVDAAGRPVPGGSSVLLLLLAA